MIWRSREPRYDVASGISQGARDYQEDAITADFPVGAEAGFVVLADGMGGHAAGDVASKIVLTEVFSELKFHFADVVAFETRAPEILRNVADLANETLRQHTRSHPETDGMGATLVVPALVENRLWWISIGDSPLFLYRNGRLSQLNEDHSMAPQIDFMVKSGLMDPQVAANHPDRNCLISVLMGTRIPKIDCPTKPFELMAGDMLAADAVLGRMIHLLKRLGIPCEMALEVRNHLKGLSRAADTSGRETLRQMASRLLSIPLVERRFLN